MKKSGDTQQKACGGEEQQQQRSTQSGLVEEEASPSHSYQVRLTPPARPPDSSTVSLQPPAYEQGAPPSVTLDEREVYIPGADEEVAGIPPANEVTDGNNGTLDEKSVTYQVRLAPATSPPDASTVSLSLPAYQQGALLSVTSNEQEVYIPGADEEVAGFPQESDTADDISAGTDQSVSSPDVPATTQLSTAQDEVFPAYLVLSPEERRRRLIEEAVSATNVHVVEPRPRDKKWSRRAKAAVAMCVVVAAIVAISLGVTLGGRKDPTRFDQVASLVNSFFNSTFEDPSSPQFQAAQWIANEDAWFGDLATVDPDRFRQRYVLALFYFATGGPTSWIETSFFLKSDVHECEWVDAVLPNTFSYSDYVGVFNCSTDHWVERIEINQNNLTGTLPDELGSLSSLANLTVFQNSIGGTLPTSLFNLSSLQMLYLRSNDFTGTIPTEVGQASSLRFLDLDANALTGPIPSEIGNLASLHELYVSSGNFLTGAIPETLFKLSSVTRIDFGQNALTGTLPPSLWSNWPNLDGFGLLKNLLSGTIPNNLDSAPLLKELVFSENNFTGPFPSSIVKLTYLALLDMPLNAFTGSLPSDWTNLSSTLERIQVNANRLTGTLPDSLGSLTKLTTLNLFHNRFNGTLPASWGNLTNLRVLQLAEDSLTGTVPKSFARLTSLQNLAFMRSELTGDLSFLCNGTEFLFPHMDRFTADCLDEPPKIICPCCTRCCSINGTCRDM